MNDLIRSFVDVDESTNYILILSNKHETHANNVFLTDTHETCRASDLFALGSIIYQMVCVTEWIETGAHVRRVDCCSQCVDHWPASVQSENRLSHDRESANDKTKQFNSFCHYWLFVNNAKGESVRLHICRRLSLGTFRQQNVSEISLYAYGKTVNFDFRFKGCRIACSRADRSQARRPVRIDIVVAVVCSRTLFKRNIYIAS